QWLSGCNGVRVPSTGTFNLQPLENNCSGGSGIQVLQVPFPATLAVSDPQTAGMVVNLNNYYVELRTAGGIFDAYSTSTRGTVFSGPTVFVYVSDNVHAPAASGRGLNNSVWTELLNMSPSGTAYTGLTAAGQSFVAPAGGPTIQLESISATGATVSVTYPNGGTGSPTCIDGTTLTPPGPSSCPDGLPSTGTAATGGSTGTGTGGAGGARATGTGGVTGTGAAGKTGASATGGTTGSSGRGGNLDTSSSGGPTGQIGTGGATSATGSGGTTSPGAIGTAGAMGKAAAETLAGGCSCSTDPGHPVPRAAVWLSLAVGLALARRRHRRGAA
ncbi:MAG TPA: MYXO-CTERM sorting domain-containing protein, partial [Trebonia sp.]|nr:MYXO-CTERM sorting domain-containing protein [Trebonia sp.]